MVSTIRQTVTVQSEGVVEVRSPELRAGDRADVIVMVREAEADQAAAALAALDALQSEAKLSDEQAAEWRRQVREERSGLRCTRCS